MNNQNKSQRNWNVALWIAQAILSIIFLWGGYMKLFAPVEKLNAMWPWTGQIPKLLLKFTGIVDALGGIGLILPGLLRIKPKLTALAALGIIVLMALAIAFHLSRGEGSVIGANIVFAIIAGFIAWGRFREKAE